MARYIRYLENGAWKYASVKSVGDLETLLTTSKSDIVSAINELISNGGALEHDLNSRFDGLDGQYNELVTITGNVQETLGQVQGDLLNKAEALYVDEEIKKLVNKADYDANYQKIEGDLLDKVDINKYNEEYQLVTGRLNDKTDLSAFEGVKGRVSTAEQEITNVKGELGTKIAKTEFDGAVGLNRWVATKYDINIGSAGAIPSFSHIKGKQPNAIIDYDDNSIIKPFTGDYYIGHYFTNVYMKVAKTVTLTVTNDDGAVIYMNGAKMYEGTTRATGLSVAMTFRAGWNTVEILHYEHSGAVEQVSLGLKLSTQVDKLTSVIGVGDKNDTRFAEAETQIKQNADAILLKAEGSVVTSLGNRVTTNEGSINVMKDEIKLLVKTEDFNKYTGRLETAESTIIQHSDQINQKVEKKDYDALNNIVGQQQTSINQLSDEIDLKATKSEFDGLNGRVGNAESKINLNTQAIALTAKQTELDKTNGRLTTAEGQLTVQAGQIATKVTQEDIDESLSPIESRVGNAESTIVQHATSIGLKANANEVYKKTEADGKVSTAITQAKGEIKIDTDKISQNVTNLTNTVTAQGNTITSHETSITQMKGDISLRAETKNVYTKTEADGKISTAVTNAKAEIKITTDGITQNVTNVQGDLDTLEGTVVAQGTQIKQTSDEVAINVVKKGNVKASINASTEGVKIGGEHIDIAGQVTFSTLDPTMQGKVNAGSNAKTQLDGMQFGMSNIIRKKQLSPVNTASSSYDEITNTWTLTANSGAGGTWGAGLRIIDKTSVVPIGSWFAVSFEIYSPIATTWNVDVNNFPVIGTSASNDNDDTAQRKNSNKSIKANTWTKCWFMWKNKDDSTSDLYDQSNIGLVNSSGAPVTFKMRNVKGELGNVVTDYSLAKEDVDEAISRVQGNLDGLQLSSRNTILDSHKDFSTTDYLINMYTLAEDFIVGQDYTFVIKGTVPAGQKFGIWMNGGTNNVGYATTTYVNGVTYVTFKAIATTAGNARVLSLYNFPQNTTTATVDWVALYKGGKPMDWMPATEDMEKLIGGASPNIILNSGFLQGMKFWGTPATGVSLDTTIDLDGIPVIKSVQSGNATDVWRGLDTALYPAPLDRPITFSIYGYTPDLTKLDAGMNVEIKCYDKDKVRITAQTYAITTTPSKSNSWERFSRTITVSGNKNIKYINLFAYVRKNGTGYFAKPMIQLGSSLGDWSPNPSDVVIDSLDTVTQDSKNAIADMSNDNKATPVEKTQLKKEWATIVAEKPQYEALATTYGITTEKTNYVNAYNALNTAITPIIADTTVTSDINGVTFRAIFDDYYDKMSQLMKKVNELSRSIGTGADTKAQDAKNSIAEMANDNKITPLEKQQLKKEWASISAEKPQYEALATGYGVGLEKTNYVNAYNTLSTFIAPFIANTTTTSDINGATFRSTFDDYYDKKAQLIKKINELSKIVAQGFNGKVLYNDPMFKNGLNDVKVYNNSANSNVTVTRVAKPSDAPTNSTHVLEIKALALPISPAYGGFSFQTTSRANAIFVTRIVAKIPVGSKIVFGSNSTGTGGKTEWLTPVTGTGNWEEYLCRVQCGSTGTFSSTNFYSIEGGTLPLTWHVAYATVIDATDYDYSITDMANDNKLTPLEKQQLKKEWATISAEKPQYEALATTYSITTEKTNYINSYNALNTFLTPLIANITVTSDVVGSTFRATFDDYYDKKAQLIKKVNELARTLANSADAKAQEAKNSIADMSSDSKITPVEKVQLAKEWAVMVAEKPQYEALSTTYGITTEKTNFVNAYNTLNTVLNGTGGILTNMTTTSAVVGATFRGQFDDYYDKKSQLVKKINETAKSLADGAQGTANTANGKADTANTNINNNKATWDRASNINSNGTFNSSKLSGAILDAQISSAMNWNGAKSLLDSWKSGTTLINGGMLATNSVFAQHIAIGDFTNLSQINEEKNPNGYATAVVNGKKYFKIGNGAYAPITIIANTYVEFLVNDEYYIAFNGYRDAGVTSLNANFRYYYSDGTWDNAGTISVLPTTADTRIAKNLKITAPPNEAKTLTAVNLFFEKDGTAGSGYYYIRDIEVRKRYTGELIVDGSIKAKQLDVTNLFADSGFITNLKAQDIDASKIKTGQLVGIYIRSDGTNAFSYMSGGSIVSKSKVANVETWIDEGLVRVKSSTSMLSLTEDNLSIGQVGKSGYGSITYTAPNTDPSQNLFSIWGVGKVVIESNQSDIILKGRAHIQGDSGGVALDFPEASSIRFDRFGNINSPSNMSSEATWSMKDADNRVRMLIPVGKGTSAGNEYHSHTGGHKFLHNNKLGISTYIQGGDSPIIQFFGQGMLKYWSPGGYFEFKNSSDNGHVPLYASSFNTPSSIVWKTDIENYRESALDAIIGTNIVTYKYKSDVEESDNPHTHVGVIVEYAPKAIQSQDGRGVDNYAMSSLAWKAIQELSEQVRYLKEKLNNR